MSLYNAVNGLQPSTFFILPMLGKHLDKYPRFRDCFVGKMEQDFENLDQFGIPTLKHGDEKLISVYTRVGGGNRESHQAEIQELRNMPEYVEDFDDGFDSTFATFVFKVPERFESDFDKIKEGRMQEVSEEYKTVLYGTFPKLKEKFDELFKVIKAE
jgi:hypothetical protein